MDHSPSLYSTLLRWVSNARNVRLKTNNNQQNQKLLSTLNMDLIEREIVDIQHRLKVVNSPIVFCHNDLNAGNMLLDSKGNISVIDYEYGSYNYRGFDLGNFFCEWTMNYKVQNYPKFKIHSELWPSQQNQIEFFHEYISETKQLQGLNNPKVTEAEIRALQQETEQYALCSHLLWSLWGIIQCGVSEIQFGFLEYSLARFELYLQGKRRLFGATSV